jgi:homoserine O-succinyltransferase/O-acetyltransferase
LSHLKRPETRDKIVALKGKSKFRTMLEDLVDENKIYRTNETLIPNFLSNSIRKIRASKIIL